MTVVYRLLAQDAGQAGLYRSTCKLQMGKPESTPCCASLHGMGIDNDPSDRNRNRIKREQSGLYTFCTVEISFAFNFTRNAMAATILFSNLGKLVPVNELPSIVIKYIHGMHAIEMALTTLLSAAGTQSVEGSSEYLGVFDAHVGDCSCHMRAQMLWELMEYARTPGNVEWMELVVDAVRDSTDKAVVLLANIRARKGRLRGLDLSPASTLTEARVFDKIDGDKFMALLDDTSTSTSDYSDESLATPDGLPPSTVLNEKEQVNLPEAVRLASETLGASRDYFSAKQSASSDNAPAPNSPSKRKYRAVEVDEWDLKDRTMVLRFLTISRLLSLKKEMYLEPGPPAYIRARTNPTAIYAEAEAQILEKAPEITINAVDRTKKLMLVKDHEKMQSYLSQLTANWVCKLSADMLLSNLIKRSTITSSRYISCVASYTSILPIRAEWFASGTPILLLVRRYHNTFYRVKANLAAWNSYAGSDRIFSLGESDWFSIQHVPLESVLSEKWAHVPHFIYISNSTDGSLSDFYDRLVDLNQDRLGSNAPHNDEGCQVYIEHMKSVAEHNFSRAFMHFFGQHKQYPFSLPEQRDGYDVIGEYVRDAIGANAENAFRDAAFSVNDTGTTSTRLHTCMHAYLEFPVIVGRQVSEMTDQGQKPAPFGYTWAR
ncbi:hypothetical protein SERLA73DRAFT_78324 [Serpula lacrymans var. lacrymans S7.3]|uniref:Uncharacterized protein n=1 Tax=Serpula lacrymans var. lacrymans (strain S7.3) TaxID=936435 RepID=F8QCS6_SERL3|nr:hypothetical protein SERLA73DRAFT_78324 [Serpula lacrymans var. lacrymans S7.3]